MELKVLNKQGQAIKASARVLGAARNTARQYVRDGGPSVRKSRTSRLDAHRDWLIQRLTQSPGIPASVLQRELDERGCIAYSGTWEANVPGHGKPAFRSMGSQFSEQGFRDMGSQLTGF